jgi:hypothetical protein
MISINERRKVYMRKLLLLMVFLLTSAMALPQEEERAPPEEMQEEEAPVIEDLIDVTEEESQREEVVVELAEHTEPSISWEFISLLFSGGLVIAFLQLLRRMKVLRYIPALFRPVVAGIIGIGTTALSAYLLANFGIEVDLSAIVAFFGAGGGATALFATGKELGLLNSEG